MRVCFGSHAYGLAAIGSGICAFVWHNVSAIGEIPHRPMIVNILAVLEVIAGVALQWRGTARAGAVALGTIYFLIAVQGTPLVLKHPLIYNGYGNFFEQFSFVSAALIIYACFSPESVRSIAAARIGFYSFGVCVISFALEQLFYLSATASLVPKWIPPGQTFWAWVTTVAFAVAGVALLVRRKAKLAAQFTAAMIVGFGLLVWLPILLADPHQFVNWSEAVETFGIAASAWIVAEYLGCEAKSAPAYPD